MQIRGFQQARGVMNRSDSMKERRCSFQVSNARPMLLLHCSIPPIHEPVDRLCLPANLGFSSARGDDRTTGEAIDERLRSTTPPVRGSAAPTCCATRRLRSSGSAQRRQVRGQRLDLGVAEVGKERIRLRGGSVRPVAAAHQLQ
jgi:hypothetical protein